MSNFFYVLIVNITSFHFIKENIVSETANIRSHPPLDCPDEKGGPPELYLGKNCTIRPVHQQAMPSIMRVILVHPVCSDRSIPDGQPLN